MSPSSARGTRVDFRREASEEPKRLAKVSTRLICFVARRSRVLTRRGEQMGPIPTSSRLASALERKVMASRSTTPTAAGTSEKIETGAPLAGFGTRSPKCDSTTGASSTSQRNDVDTLLVRAVVSIDADDDLSHPGAGSCRCNASPNLSLVRRRGSHEAKLATVGPRHLVGGRKMDACQRDSIDLLRSALLLRRGSGGGEESTRWWTGSPIRPGENG
jgi:hypothetical protein